MEEGVVRPLAAAVFCLALAGCAARPAGGPPPRAGVVELQTTIAAARGRPLLVVFWATWCRPCVAEISTLSTLHHDLEPRGLSVLGVTQDVDDLGALREFARAHAVAYTLLVDPGGAVAARYGLSVLPSLVAVDRAGLVRWKTTGATSGRALRRVLEPLLAV
jgi:thiol-disulfide isomerase/thioredoxin